MSSLEVSRNEFSGVPVFQPEQNPEWQSLIDQCDLRMRTVALVGISAVQAGIDRSADLRERLLSVAETSPLLGDTHKVTSELFGPIYDAGDGWSLTHAAMPDSSILIEQGLYTIALARKLSRILRMREGLGVPVSKEAPVSTDPPDAGTHTHMRISDMFAHPYWNGGRMKGILSDYSIDLIGINVTDIHAISTDSPAAATYVDLQPSFRGNSWWREKGHATGLFITLGVEISDNGLVQARTESGEVRPDGEEETRLVNPYQGFDQLGRYAHYLSAFSPN